MKKSQLKSKLAAIIYNLDEIINAETEQTHGLAVVKKCRNDLQKALDRLNARRGAIDSRELLLRIYRLIDCAYFFIMGKN